MFLSEISIRRPVFTAMVIIALMVFGYISFKQSPVDLMPKVDFPFVSIRVIFPGASPEVVESEVTDKIEEAVSLLPGIKTIQSVSAENVALIYIEFEIQYNIDIVTQDVRDKVSGILGDLPKDVEIPVVEKLNFDAIPILGYIFSADMPAGDLARFVEDRVKTPLQQVGGVGSITLLGVRSREVRVWLDLEKMKSLSVSPMEVQYALQSKNVEIPGGRIESTSREYIVKTTGELKTVREFGEIVIRYSDGRPIKLKDIADVEDGLEDRRTLARYNGKPAVGFLVLKQSGTNTLQVAEDVKAEVARLNSELPTGMVIVETQDSSIFIRDSFDSIISHIFEGGLIATIIVFLFLRNFRSTLIAGIAIPTSIISTFIFMRAMDFTLNMISLLALGLSVGMLIDDAIVVLENVYRHTEKGEDAKTASFQATREIGLAVMATTFTIVAVFVPVAYMKGMIGKFFYQFGLTVSFAVLVSLFISFTLTPMLTSRFLGVHGHQGRFFTLLESGFLSIEAFYKRMLGWALRHKWLTVFIAIGAFLSSFVLLPLIGTEFQPAYDDAQFSVNLEAEQGTTIDVIEGYIVQAEDILKSYPEITTIFATVGSGSIQEVNRAGIYVKMVDRSKRKIGRDDFMAEIRKRFRDIPGLKVTVTEAESMESGMGGRPVQYILTGHDINQLQRVAESITTEMKATPGFVEVDTDFQSGKPEVRVNIDRQRAADLGIDILTIASTINALVSGEQAVTKFKEGGNEYDVKMRLKDEYRNQPEDLLRLMAMNGKGDFIDLISLASIETASGPSRINHYSREREITVQANLEGVPMGTAIKTVDQIAAGKLEPGVTAKWGGFADIMIESFQSLSFALFLAVLLIYMILASQYEHFIHPLVIMFALPLAVVGAFLGLLIAGHTLSIVSFIGIIMLMGLVTKNGILVVDFTNQLRRQGMSTHDALLTAGPIRLRPILMTTFSTIGGMIPIVLGLGSGAEFRAPMASAVIGGLTTSTLLTLIVVPVVYSLMDSMVKSLKRLFGRGSKTGMDVSG